MHSISGHHRIHMERERSGHVVAEQSEHRLFVGMVVGLAGASLLLLIVGIQNSSSVFKRVSACAPMACVAFAAVSWVAGNFTADGIPKIIASSALGFGLSCILSLLVISLAFEAHENPHALAIGEIALSLCALYS